MLLPVSSTWNFLGLNIESMRGCSSASTTFICFRAGIYHFKRYAGNLLGAINVGVERAGALASAARVCRRSLV
jgi:hypothetical protein